MRHRNSPYTLEEALNDYTTALNHLQGDEECGWNAENCRDGFRKQIAHHRKRILAFATLAREGWKEATIAWNVCHSIHRTYAQKKDAFYTIRQADFARHHASALARFNAANTPASAP